MLSRTCDVLFFFLTALYPSTFHFFRKDLVEASDVRRIVIVGVGCKLKGQKRVM